MTVRKLFPLALLLAAASAFAADAAGTWKGVMHTREGGNIDVSLTLKASAGALTGSITQGTAAAKEIEDGKVNGDKVSFMLTYTSSTGDTRKVSVTGTMEGNHLKLTALREGQTRGNDYSLDRQ